MLFEGRDAAGKGGIIKRLTERTSPRVFRVVALPAPTEREKSQMYIQRYLPYLPAAGEVVLFDRSWYSRAGVERVMGLSPEAEVRSSCSTCAAVERAILASGVVLVKYWLEVSMANQTERFEERIHDPRKIWKLSPMDLEAYRRWYDFSRARDAMFAATDTPQAPWSRGRQRPAPDAPELHRPPLEPDPLRAGAARRTSSCPSARGRRLRRAGLPYRSVPQPY